MVDNFDTTNNLYILSYKKYIEHSMAERVTELMFDKEYVGTLTNNPSDFGIFVEIGEYYTGLIHSSEFENYSEVRKTYRIGDKISVYIKDVNMIKGKYRIMLTCDKTQISNEKQQWQILRNKTENNSFPYHVNKDNESISIEIDGELFNVSLPKQELSKNFNNFPLVRVFKVDPINKSVNFEFITKQNN